MPNAAAEAIGPGGTRRFFGPTLLTVLLLGVGTVLVQPVSYMLSHPFWYDESWVAVARYAPFSYMPAVNYPAPTGWVFLLRLPWPGEQGLRLLTLAFSAAGVIGAYVFARSLDWGSRRAREVIGILCALAVMVSPWALSRIDLKWYTADAFFAVLLLWMAGRAEANWSRRNILQLAVVASVASILSWTSMFVSVGVFVGLFVAAAFRKDRAGLVNVAVGGAGVALILGVVYAVFLAPFSWVLGDFWERYFLEGTVADMTRSIWWRFRALMDFYPDAFLLPSVGLFLVGWIVIGRKSLATASSLVVIGVFMLVLAFTESYPLLDRRTSHFLLVLFAAVTAVGAGWLSLRLLERNQVAGLLAVAAVAVGLVWAGIPYFNKESLPDQDIRAQVRYVEVNRGDGDVVVVAHLARYGFGYYWRGGSLEFNNTVHFTPRVVGDGTILYELGDVTGTLEEAIEIAGGAGGSGRVWVVRTFRSQFATSWVDGYAGLGIVPSSIPVGPEPLEYFDVGR